MENEIINSITSDNSEIRVNTFTFVEVNPRSNENDNLFCETRISVYDEEITNQPYLTVKLDSRYSDGTPIKSYSDVIEHSCHPMISFKHNNLISYFKGFSVIKNEMTEKMIEYILKEDCELSEFTGSITPKSYRRSLLQSLAMLSE